MDEMKSYNFLKSNFSSHLFIQITLKNCLKCLKVTFSLVFVGRPRLKVVPHWMVEIKIITTTIVFHYCMRSQSIILNLCCHG